MFLIRKHIASYKVDGDQVSRIAPLASEPEGFLDEWFSLPWAEASKWISGTALTTLRQWHAKMHDRDSSAEIHFFSEFLYDPPACSISNRQWTIGIRFEASEGKKLPQGMPSKAYFTVTSNENGDYFIKNVSLSGLRKCLNTSRNCEDE
jgi:hypothetical protein